MKTTEIKYIGADGGVEGAQLPHGAIMSFMARDGATIEISDADGMLRVVVKAAPPIYAELDDPEL